LELCVSCDSDVVVLDYVFRVMNPTGTTWVLRLAHGYVPELRRNLRDVGISAAYLGYESAYIP
jgi:hypothetical protein